MENQRISHGTGELAQPLKGIGPREGHSRSLSLMFVIYETE